MIDRCAGRRSLIIFDFDGTLADTWDWLADEVVSGAPSLGYRAVSREELESLRSLSTRQVFKKLGISWWRMFKGGAAPPEPSGSSHERNSTFLRVQPS